LLLASKEICLTAAGIDCSIAALNLTGTGRGSRARFTATGIAARPNPLPQLRILPFGRTASRQDVRRPDATTARTSA
jgi:hypothetical protein